MKRIIAFGLVLLFALSLIGCTKPEPIADPVPAEEMVQLANDTAVDFLLADTYVNAMEAFQVTTGSEARKPKVLHAMEYQTDDLYGFPVHVLLLRVEGDMFVRNGIYDATEVMVDLTTGEVYDSLSMNIDEWSTSFNGDCKDEHDVRCYLLNRYFSYLHNNETQFCTEKETIIPLGEEQIAEINAGL